jgi:hypothetical protein
MAVRKAIGDHRPTPQLLRTVRGYGYRFVAPVEVHESTSPAEPLRSGLPFGEPVLTPEHPFQPLPTVACTAATTANLDAPSPDGEYKPVSVLCCTLGEVPVCHTRSDQEARYRLMRTVFGLAEEVVPHYGGTITSYAGDSFTAVFGAPVAQEDHARRAVMAALDLSQRLRQRPPLHTFAAAHGPSSPGMWDTVGRPARRFPTVRYSTYYASSVGSPKGNRPTL